MRSPEELARKKIDKLLTECGWILQNRSTINLSASRGIAIREALLKDRDEVDYLLFVDGKAIGTVEAKPEGFTLTGVEEQSGKYGKGLLDIYPKWREPLAFAYESTGVETQFTNQLDPSPKSRNVFAFHRPETLLEYLDPEHQLNTRLANLLTTDQMSTSNLWSAQIEAIRNLERSLGRQQAPRPHPDGHRQRQDLHRRQLRLPPHQARWRAPRPLPRQARQPRRPDPERIPAVRYARRRPQVHRALQRPALAIRAARPRLPRVHLHHPAPLLHAARRRDRRRDR